MMWIFLKERMTNDYYFDNFFHIELYHHHIVSLRGRIKNWSYFLLPFKYFYFSSSSIFSLGKITLWMNRLLNLLAIVSPFFSLAFSSLEFFKILYIFYLSLSICFPFLLHIFVSEELYCLSTFFHFVAPLSGPKWGIFFFRRLGLFGISLMIDSSICWNYKVEAFLTW